MKDSSKRGQHGMTLLLHGRKITADMAKSGGPNRTAKGARNLLLNFGHPKVSFGEIVAKRKPQVIEQSQHLIGTQEQRIQQILGLALLAPAFALVSRRGARWGLSSIASSQDLKIAGDPVVTLDALNRGTWEQTPLLTGLMQIKQEVLHLSGPLLMLLLSDCHTIAQQVRPTDAVSAVIAIIARKSVVHASPAKARP